MINQYGTPIQELHPDVAQSILRLKSMEPVNVEELLSRVLTYMRSTMYSGQHTSARPPMQDATSQITPISNLWNQLALQQISSQQFTAGTEDLWIKATRPLDIK